MKTAIITIDAAAEDGYTVAFARDDNRDNWPDRPVAREPMPPLVGPDKIRECLLKADGLSDELNGIGIYLGGLLLPGKVRTEFKSATRRRPAAADGCDGTRILLDVRPDELRKLPWELARISALPLFADECNPWSRVHDFEPGAARPSECWPMLRVLIVVGADPEEEQIHAQEEAQDVKQALIRLSGLVDLEVLDRPTRAELKRVHNEHRPHVLHFIGHGGDGVLDFSPRDGQPGWEWGPNDIAVDLQTFRPQLVVLNACRTAELSEQDGAWLITDAFSTLGIPATVTMQGDIDGRASTAFARELYEGLAHDAPIDLALTKARNEISVARSWKHQDPFLPCLTLSVSPDRVLPKRYGVTSVECDEIIRRSPFRRVYAFADRKQYRRELWRRLGESSPHDRHRGAVAVTGDPKVGKSELVKWCLGSLALRGANVAYVDLHGRGRLDSLETLGMIAEELALSPTYADGNRAAFDEWLERVDAAQGHSPPPTPLGEGRYLRKLGPGSETIAADLFEAFLAALEQAAGTGDLVIGLDNLESVETAHWRSYVRSLLIQPIAEGRVPVRLIIVGEPNKLEKQVGAGIWQRVEPPIHVGSIQDPYAEVIGQYLGARGFEPAEYEEIVLAMAAKAGGEWKADHFEAVERLTRAFTWTEKPWQYT